MIKWIVQKNDLSWVAFMAKNFNDFLNELSEWPDKNEMKQYEEFNACVLRYQNDIVLLTYKKNTAAELGYAELAAQYQAQIDALEITLTAIQNAPVIGE